MEQVCCWAALGLALCGGCLPPPVAAAGAVAVAGRALGPAAGRGGVERGAGDRGALAMAERLGARDIERLYDRRRHPFSQAGEREARTSGWALVALARTLENLPEDEPLRGRLEALFGEVAGALPASQRGDGTW